MPKKSTHNWGYPTSIQDAEEGQERFEQIIRELDAEQLCAPRVKSRKPALGLFVLSVTITFITIAIDQGLISPARIISKFSTDRANAATLVEHKAELVRSHTEKGAGAVWNCLDSYTNDPQARYECEPLHIDSTKDAQGNKYLTRPWKSE